MKVIASTIWVLRRINLTARVLVLPQSLLSERSLHYSPGLTGGRSRGNLIPSAYLAASSSRCRESRRHVFYCCWWAPASSKLATAQLHRLLFLLLHVWNRHHRARAAAMRDQIRVADAWSLSPDRRRR